MQPITVLEVIRQGQVGGGESHLLDLIAGFKENVRPIVLSFTGGQMIDTLRERGIACYVIETSHPFDLRVRKEVKEIVRQENVQIIHAHGTRAASNVLFVAKSLKLPMIYTVHGWSFHQDQSWLVRTVRQLSERVICRNSKKVICVSESNKDTGVEAFGLKNVTVIENGINLRRFNPRNTFKDIRKELRFADEDFIIGFVARITLQKNPIEYVKSVAMAHQRDPRIKGLMIGEGDMLDETRQVMESMQAQDYIYTLPFRSDIPDILNAIDVYCLPSLWEGLSIALLEAMAMGKPLVVTPTDGTRDIITDKVNGLIVPFSDTEAIAEAYLTYLNQPELKEACGRNALKLVEERFDSQRVSDQVTEIYKEVRSLT